MDTCPRYAEYSNFYLFYALLYTDMREVAVVRGRKVRVVDVLPPERLTSLLKGEGIKGRLVLDGSMYFVKYDDVIVFDMPSGNRVVTEAGRSGGVVATDVIPAGVLLKSISGGRQRVDVHVPINLLSKAGMGVKVMFGRFTADALVRAILTDYEDLYTRCMAQMGVSDAIAEVKSTQLDMIEILKDLSKAVDRIDGTVKTVQERLGRNEQRLDRLEEMLSRIEAAIREGRPAEAVKIAREAKSVVKEVRHEETVAREEVGDMPSFIVDNPWVGMLARRGG